MTAPATPAGALSGLGAAVPLQQVEKEISQQLRAAKDAEAEGPVQRVRMSNLVIYCDSAEAGARLSEIIGEVVVSHPARVLLLVGEKSQPSAGIAVRVLVQCRELATGHQACVEQIVLQAGGQSVLRLPSAVRSLLIGDLPTNLWWAVQTPPPLGAELLFDLAESVQQIIYDSVGWADPPRGVAATAAWIEGVEQYTPGRWRVVSDLNWRRLKYWRRILSEALSVQSAPGAAATITRVQVEHGPHAVVRAYLLVAWLAQRLGWTLRSGKITSAAETTWRFAAGNEEIAVFVKRLTEGEPRLRRVRITCAISDKPVTMDYHPAEDGQRLAIALEGLDVAARTVTTPRISPSELIGKQLSDRERDPVFRHSMTMAQQMAQVLLR